MVIRYATRFLLTVLVGIATTSYALEVVHDRGPERDIADRQKEERRRAEEEQKRHEIEEQHRLEEERRIAEEEHQRQEELQRERERQREHSGQGDQPSPDQGGQQTQGTGDSGQVVIPPEVTPIPVVEQKIVLQEPPQLEKQRLAEQEQVRQQAEKHWNDEWQSVLANMQKTQGGVLGIGSKWAFTEPQLVNQIGTEITRIRDPQGNSALALDTVQQIEAVKDIADGLEDDKNSWFATFKRFGEESRTTILNDLKPIAEAAITQELADPLALQQFSNTESFMDTARIAGGYYDTRLKQLSGYEDLLTRQLSMTLTQSTVNELRGRINEIEHYREGKEAIPVRPHDILAVADNEFKRIVQDQQLSTQQVQDKFKSSLEQFKNKILPEVNIAPELQVALFELERVKDLQARLDAYGLDRYINENSDPAGAKTLQDLQTQLRQQVEQLTEALYKTIGEQVDQLQGDEATQLKQLIDLEKILDVARRGNAIVEGGKVREVENQTANKIAEEMRQKEISLRYEVGFKNLQDLVNTAQQQGVSSQLTNFTTISPISPGNIVDLIKQKYNYEQTGLDFDRRKQLLQQQRDEFNRVVELLDPLLKNDLLASSAQITLQENYENLQRRVEQADNYLKQYATEQPKPVKVKAVNREIPLDIQLELYLKIPQDQYLVMNKEFESLRANARKQISTENIPDAELQQKIDDTIREQNKALLNNIFDIYESYPDIILKNGESSADFFDAAYRTLTGEKIPLHLRITAEIQPAIELAQYTAEEISASTETGFKQFLKNAGETFARIAQSFPDAVTMARFTVGDFLAGKGAVTGGIVGFFKVLWNSWDPIKALFGGFAVFGGLKTIGNFIKPSAEAIKELNARRDAVGKAPLGNDISQFDKVFKDWAIDDSSIPTILKQALTQENKGVVGRTVDAGLKYAGKVYGRVKGAVEDLLKISDNNQRLLQQATANFDTAKKHLYQTLHLHPDSPSSAIYKALEDKKKEAGTRYAASKVLDTVLANFVTSGKQLVDTHKFVVTNFIENIADINKDIMESGNQEAQQVLEEVQQGKIVSFGEAFGYFDTIFKNQVGSVQAMSEALKKYDGNIKEALAKTPVRGAEDDYVSFLKDYIEGTNQTLINGYKDALTQAIKAYSTGEGGTTVPPVTG
jgi:hypothetical protein